MHENADFAAFGVFFFSYTVLNGCHLNACTRSQIGLHNFKPLPTTGKNLIAAWSWRCKLSLTT